MLSPTARAHGFGPETCARLRLSQPVFDRARMRAAAGLDEVLRVDVRAAVIALEPDR